MIYNIHKFCIGTDKIKDSNGPLNKNFILLAENWDDQGKKYIALVEHKKLPIYATQFHPEKSDKLGLKIIY